MGTKRNIIEIDEALCNGCGACVPSCAEGAIRIIDGKARLVAEKFCDGLGACLGECPTGALRIVEREAANFDERAVQANIAAPTPHVPVNGGCPSARIHAHLNAARKSQCAPAGDQPSCLAHWPVQIRLVPPHAPFLDGADLLVAADCVPVAYPNFHRDFLEDRKVMIGCPKFDDGDLYVERFRDIFLSANIKSVTVVVMQVPCCQALPIMVAEGMQAAGKEVPLEKVIVGLEGEILRREPILVATH